MQTRGSERVLDCFQAGGGNEGRAHVETMGDCEHDADSPRPGFLRGISDHLIRLDVR